MATLRQPVLFIGHGSPMNAITDNHFSRTLRQLGQKISRPKAVVCVSAHWMTEGTWITGMEKPKTIHDFYGFPQSLFDVQYPAMGNPVLARAICSTVTSPKEIHFDSEMWGFDHGTWSVMRHLYPDADVPVLQLSLYMEQPAAYHFRMGEALRFLREQGVLIVGSGNIVHNLGTIRWEENAKPFDWAVEFDEWSKEKILSRDFEALIHQYDSFSAGKMSVPTPDHYYPFLYTLGASDEKDRISFEYEEIQNGSISMRTVLFAE